MPRVSPYTLLFALFVLFAVQSGEPIAPAETPAKNALPDPTKPASAKEIAAPLMQDGERIEIIVVGRAENLTGAVPSASQGRVGAAQIQARPIQRTGEVLETVPGMIVTQHAGNGKANQYFFRGFNLDHGTDFGTWVQGMPVNMPTHGHGQGYTDLNFVIPELIRAVNYKKGVYYASEGDFSSTGSAHVSYVDKLDRNIAEVSGGMFGYGRVLLAGSPKLEGGNILGALELETYDGPWEYAQKQRKLNAVLGYSKGDEENGWSITSMAYSNAWNSTDQIPRRAVKDSSIDRFDSLDSSNGGRSMRYSLSGEWHRESAESRTRVSAYAYHYQLNLFSNFTYFLDNPDEGDQFEQEDKRVVAGTDASHTFINEWRGYKVENTLGIGVRHDNIPRVGLYGTNSRTRLNTVRRDQALQTSVSPYFESNVQWLDKLRTVIGLRGEMFYFDVDGNRPENRGVVKDSAVSPKVSVIMGPWHKTEFYLNFGLGIHSNDARGTVTTVDPKSDEDVKVAPPLVEQRGGEFGIRTTWIPNLNTTLALFVLDSDSELVFVGDAGTVEASRASRRMGIEFANYYSPLEWLTFDLDISLNHARFRDSAPEGDHIPGAIESVIATGIAVDHKSGFYGALRLRYFGGRPLIEDDSARSNPTAMLSAKFGYHFNTNVAIYVEGFNLLNREDSDIDYFYGSRLNGEAADGVEDKHFHPVEPISVRAGVKMTW